MNSIVELFLASSNPGKLEEFRALARSADFGTVSSGDCAGVETRLLPRFDSLPLFDENAPTFAENAAGKALHYSQFTDGLVVADDSGLVVRALGGEPGVRSARYAGPNATNAQRIEKLLNALDGKRDKDRAGHFVCAIALVKGGRAIAIVTARVDGVILESPRGNGGFGYDPVFYFPPLKKTFAELSAEEKNEHSHRGKAFLKLLAGLRATK